MWVKFILRLSFKVKAQLCQDVHRHLFFPGRAQEGLAGGQGLHLDAVAQRPEEAADCGTMPQSCVVTSSTIDKSRRSLDTGEIKELITKIIRHKTRKLSLLFGITGLIG